MVTVLSWERAVRTAVDRQILIIGIPNSRIHFPEMAQPRSKNNKRAIVDGEATKEEDQDVRLCAVLRGLLGGSKYVKQSELSREVLLRYAIQKGDVVPVTLFTVTVQKFGGSIFDVKMEEKQRASSS